MLSKNKIGGFLMIIFASYTVIATSQARNDHVKEGLYHVEADCPQSEKHSGDITIAAIDFIQTVEVNGRTRDVNRFSDLEPFGFPIVENALELNNSSSHIEAHDTSRSCVAYLLEGQNDFMFLCRQLNTQAIECTLTLKKI